MSPVFFMAHATTALTNDEYRSVKAWSKSDLDYAHDSTALLEWARNTPSEGSDSVDLGTHLHCALLEPDIFSKNYIKIPDFGTSKDGKLKADKFNENMKGKITLDTPTHEKVIAMRDSALAHPVAKQLLTLSGVSESSIFGEIQGLEVKCRPDRIVGPEHLGHILVDVKKTADIDKFIYSVRDFRYHVQAAYYSDIYKQLTGHTPRFVFIVIGEKRSIGRHPVRVYELTEDVVNIGRAEYLEDMEKVREYQDFGCGFEVEQLNMRGIIR